MSLKRYIAEAMQQPKVDAVVGWGRGMGHKGHMLLARAVIVQAQQLKATPFFFVSETMGKDDPLTPEEKLYIYKKVFPQQAGIFHSGSTLANVLTDVGQQYKNVVLVLGEDQVQPFQWLLKPDKSGNVPYQSYGLQSLQIISRQQVNDPSQSEEGPRATPMREVLKDPNATEQEQFAYWRDAMPDALSDEEVMHFMNLAKSRLNVPKKVKEPKQKAAKQIKDKALKESVVDIVRKAKPLLKEASLEKKLQFVKLMKVALKEGFDERMALIRKLASTGKYDISDLELASDEELEQLLAQEKANKEDQLKRARMNRGYFEDQGVAEGVGDNINDPAPSMEFVSNKYVVKFTPTEVLFYKGGELVYRKLGDYSNPTRGEAAAARGITANLWEKDRQGLVPNLEFVETEKKLADELRELNTLERTAQYGTYEKRKYAKKYKEVAAKLKHLRSTQSQWKKKSEGVLESTDYLEEK